MAHKIRNYNIFNHFCYYVPGMVDLFVLAVWFLAGVLAGNLLTLAFTKIYGSGFALKYGMLAAYPLMFIPAMMYAGAKSRQACLVSDGIRLDSRHYGNGFISALVCIAAVFSAGFCCDALNSLLPEMPENLKSTIESMTKGPLWSNLLCVSVFAPFFEEWLCRGTILRGLVGRGMKKWGAVVISSLIFALIHMNPWQAVPAFLLGLLFGYIYCRTGSLRLTMLMHCFNNSIAVFLSRIEGLSECESWMQILPGKLYWPAFSFCAIVISLSLLYFHRTGSEDAFDKVPPLFGKMD